MGRPQGSRNATYEQARDRLAAKVQERLLAPDGPRASFRELAAAAGVGVPTLRHYFGSREGAFRAALSRIHTAGMPYLLALTRPPPLPLRESIRGKLVNVIEGMQAGLGSIHAAGLALGLRDPELGPAYLETVLEPTLQAFEACLAHHAARDEIREGADLRLAALQLVGPLLLASLHQSELGGASCRPLDLPALVDPHLEAWLRAWARAPVELHPRPKAARAR